MLQLCLVIASFAVVIFLVSRKWPMAYAIGLGSLLIAFATGTGIPGFARALTDTLKTLNTYELCGGVLLISLLARLLREFGMLERMSDSFARLLGNVKLALALVPGLLGCLPVFGGAIMSAPIVDTLGDELGLDGARKAAVNLTFRHGWFFIFPFMPSLVLVAAMSGQPVGAIVGVMFPLSLVALIFAYFFLFRGSARYIAARKAVQSETAATAEAKPAVDRLAAAREFLLTAAPLLIAVVLTLAFKVRLVFAMVVGVASVIVLGRKHPKCTPATIFKSLDWMLVLTMVAITLFKGVLDQAGFIKTLVGGLAARGIPPVVLFLTLPAVTGLATGAQQASLAFCMPLLLPLATGSVAVATALIYAGSFLGYFLSPLHLCTVLTAQYFKAKLGDVYAGLVPVAAAVAVASVVLALITGGGVR